MNSTVTDLDEARRARQRYEELTALEHSLSFHAASPINETMSEQRISTLEARMTGVEGRLDRMEGKIDRIGDVLTDIRVDLAKKPSTAALWTMVATVLGLALAIAFGTFTVASFTASLSQPPPVVSPES